MTRALLALLLALPAGNAHAASPAASQPSGKTQARSVAVLDIAAKGSVPKGSAEVFNEILQNDIRSLGHKVIGRSDIEQMLGLEKLKDSVGCTSTSCLAEIGGALGVDELVSGVIARVGSYLVITIKRVDPKKGEVVRQAVRTLKKASEDAIVESVQPIVNELYGQARVQRPPPEPAQPDDTLGQMTDLMARRRWRQLLGVAGAVVQKPPNGAAEEQAQNFVVRAHEALKDDAGVVREGERFLGKFPQSALASVMRILIDAATERQRLRQDGVKRSTDEIAKLSAADRENPCKTGPILQTHKQYARARADLEACLKGGDHGGVASAFLLVLVTWELGDFKATARYLAQLRDKNPELYRNVKHFETMLPLED